MAELRTQRPGRSRTLARGRDGGVTTRTVLPGGLRVITESMPGSRAASFGVWVGVGSRDEKPSLAGTSHFLEHLLFKGTRRRTALEISASVESVGGDLNAFTAKEYTCFYAHVLDDDLPLAVDVVCDVVADALIAVDDVEAERGVILEEIAMREDDPADLAHDVFTESLFGDTPVGRPIIGTTAHIETLRRDQIAGYYRRRYQLPEMVVAAAGNVDHRRLVRLVRKAFGHRLVGDIPPAGVRVSGRRVPLAPARPVTVLTRRTEQANLVLGVVGLSRHDDRRFVQGVLSAALGGGASSRLFQEVREKRGLAYSVYTFTQQYAETGCFGIYAGCQPKRVHDVLAIIREQLADVAANGLTADELARGKGQLRGGLALGMEDAESRMTRLGKAELSYGEVLELDEMLELVSAVTAARVQELAADLMSRPAALSVVGPLPAREFARYRRGLDSLA
ncbi:MAG: M16 family metallopeptidase [Mycobacteriales bacterium]